jgi:alpha-tubulin suppressor-like RCC1 family protein
MIGADAWSTGDDQYGQVGNGTPYAKVNTKVKVITGGVVDIEAGPWSVCALVFSGIKCWGGNAYGELGRGTTSSGEASPDWAHEWDAWTISKLALGDGNTCAILNSSGLAKCIGYNGEGQLGVNYTSSEEIHPVTPNGFSAGVLQVSLGYHNMCALDSGHIRCAGDNTYDQIGSTSPLVNNPQLFPFTVQGF